MDRENRKYVQNERMLSEHCVKFLHSSSWWRQSATYSVQAGRRAWGRPVAGPGRQHPGWSPAGNCWRVQTPTPASWSSSGGPRGERISAVCPDPAYIQRQVPTFSI